MNESNHNYIEIYEYHGALGDIAYFDCINEAISKKFCEKYPEKSTGFVNPVFSIQKISFPRISFENHHLSADEIIPKDPMVSKKYFPYKDSEDISVSSKVETPSIENGYRAAINQIIAYAIIGSDNVITARTSYLLRKYLLSKEGEKDNINLFDILIRFQMEDEENRKAIPVNSKITDLPQAKSAAFCLSIKSTMEKIYKHNETAGYIRTDKETYDYVMELADRFRKIAEYEYAPSTFSYGTLSEIIYYSINIDGEDLYNTVTEYFKEVLSVYDSLEKDPESRFPILCKELLSHI